jgi:uncharacterized RDD family membrane protein YckC
MSEQITITSAGGVEVELDLVALGGRSYAFIMDWHIRVLAALAWFLFGLLSLTGGFVVQDSKVFSSGTSLFYLVLLPSLAIYFLYHPVLEIAMHGRTPGKRMAGIRIVAKDGRSASSGAILLRNVFRLIDSLPIFYVLGILVCLFNKQHLRIGDMAAGTILVYEEHASKKRLNLIMDNIEAQTLSTPQRELVAEVLERWRELDPARRRQMAQDLLRKFGQPLPAGKGLKLDHALQASLQHVLK